MQTHWYLNDHLFNQNLSETTQSPARFFENKAVPGQMRKNIVHTRQSIQMCHFDRTTWENMTAIFYILATDLDYCSPHFGRMEKTESGTGAGNGTRIGTGTAT